jgi:hypothetical protein
MDGDMYTCPVCFYPELIYPPQDFNICPCCGVEFENDDYETSHAELRQQWLHAGAPWFSSVRKSSEAWQQELERVRAK